VGFLFWTKALDQSKEDGQMAGETKAAEKQRSLLSLDGWAVGIALLLALLVRLGILKHVGW
jgi:hypothetical protein